MRAPPPASRAPAPIPQIPALFWRASVGRRRVGRSGWIVQYPRNNRLANRVFADAATADEACRKAWDRFAAAPDRIASIMRREWTDLPAPAHTDHNG